MAARTNERPSKKRDSPQPNDSSDNENSSVNKRYFVDKFGSVNGAARMKQEIYERGPISCGIQATEEFVAYTGGIYSQFILLPVINHEIAVVGYGIDADSGTEYWIGRNSWGTYWGEGGFFRMATGRHGLGIESDCIAAIPSFDKPKDEPEFITA